MQWLERTFSQLTLDQLYDVLKLRLAVFSSEQACVYTDLDNKDRLPDCRHLLCFADTLLVGYCRILAPGSGYPDEICMGRVVVDASRRGEGLGHELFRRGLAIAIRLWPEQDVKISAQAHLQKFYEQHDFSRVSEEYLEDNIPHVAMIYRCN